MTLEVQVKNDCVSFGDDLSIRFQRTLRIPDDGRSYPLPPGLGAFPLRRIDDHADRVPADWLGRGGVFLPMYQREAMWISFGSLVPHAVKIAVGKVCALTGKPWTEGLHDDPQDYLVAPPQPWLDGISVGGGRIRQFVAMPLGMGYTVEGQITGEERFGGIQIKVCAAKPGRFPPSAARAEGAASGAIPPPACAAPGGGRFRASRAVGGRAMSAGSMGLGAGGSMVQKVYPDLHGIETWDPGRSARLYVHIVNSALWREITGERPPESPVTVREYERHGLPWFELYDEDLPTLKGARALKQIRSIKELDGDMSKGPLQDDESVEPSTVNKLYSLAKHLVRDGRW